MASGAWRIYLSEHFHALLDVQAHENVRAALAVLDRP
jgi:hypothetical protein